MRWLALVLVVLGVAAACATAPKNTVSWSDATAPAVPRDRKARLVLDKKPLALFTREWSRVPVTMTNLGAEAWVKGQQFLGYRLLGVDGGVISTDTPRTPMPSVGTVEPRVPTPINLRFEVPADAGTYRYELGVIDGQGFMPLEGPAPTFEVTAGELFAGFQPPRDDFSLLEPGVRWRVDGHEALNRLQRLIARTLETNRVSFDFHGQRAAGYSAGVRYSQIWARDSATIAPFTSWVDGPESLTGWIFAHLQVQKESGELFDWVRDTQIAEKNDVVSDQEASLVIAAKTATDVLGPAWLRRTVNGQRVIDRLDAAISWLFRERGDPESKLIWSGHTADWGDVSPDFADQRCTKLMPQSQRVVGIYSQAMAYQAVVALAYLWHELGENDRANTWIATAQSLQRNTYVALWDERQGYFQIHQHVSGAPHDAFNEAEMFAMGGNASAIVSGLAFGKEADRILDTARTRAQKFNLSTLSGVLIPPYPQNFFRHEQVRDPWTYQNGGQWDWFGGRLVKAMFQRGAPGALRALEAMAEKNLSHGGFFEWDTPRGEARGSPNFAGAAAVLGSAVVEGLFGVSRVGARVVLKPSPELETGYLALVRENHTGLAFSRTVEGGRATLTIESTSGVDLCVGTKLKTVKVDGKSMKVELLPSKCSGVLVPRGRHVVADL